MTVSPPHHAGERLLLWILRHPWWVAAALVTALTLLQPMALTRIDTLLCEVLVDTVLPVDLIHNDLPAASLWLQLSASLLPLLLVGARTLRHPQDWRGRWLLALCLLPIGLAVLGVALLDHWIAPASAMLGWAVGCWLWRAGHLRDTRVELLKTRGQADATLRAITDAVFTVDADHRVQLMNPVAAQLAQSTNRTSEDLPAASQRRITELLLLDARDESRFDDAIDTCLRQGRVIEIAQPVALMRHGQDRLLRVTASPIFERRDSKPGTGHAERAVVVLSDMTDIVRTSARLLHEASHDPLTGLLNRVTLADHFAQALGQARQAGGQLALLFIDLDRFKRINDSLGHRHGDAVLKIVAHRLREQVVACAGDAFLARWGGDEFVVLVEDTTEGLAAHAMACKLIEAVSRDIGLDDLDVQCSCSVGVALAPDQADTLDALLTLADAGMRRAKLHGGGRAEFSLQSTGMPTSAPWTRDVLTLEARLRRALHSGELELFYQPQLDVVSGEAVGLEALLRWHQGNGVMWTPNQFLDVAEESGLILDIGAWAIREATRQLAKWRSLGMSLIPVSINVSARQCLDRRLVQVVSQALADERIPASLLKLEITETTAMTDVEQVMHLLAELRELGVGVAVDDFGTGYSSLAHLQRLPIDQIKIDQSFVRDIANDRHGAAIVRATIALAHELGVPVVAEGVEHESQLSFLTLHRCDIAQGYFFAKPLSGADTGAYLRDPRRNPPQQRTLGLG